MEKAIILQPGKLGDLIITLPIAHYYFRQGYEIFWPVFDNFIPFLSRFEWIKPISFNISIDNNLYYSKKRLAFWEEGKNSLKEINPSNKIVFDTVDFFTIFYKNFDDKKIKVIDPCFSFPGHRNALNNQKTVEYTNNGKNWIQLKYDLVQTPLKERWNFVFERNLKKENTLLDFIKDFSKKKYGSEEYSIVHTYESTILPKFDVKNPINFSYIKGYEILDWLTVLENARSIVCIDSSLANFVEVNKTLENVEKFYLGSEETHFHPYMRNILLNNWINLSKSDILYTGLKIE